MSNISKTATSLSYYGLWPLQDITQYNSPTPRALLLVLDTHDFLHHFPVVIITVAQRPVFTVKDALVVETREKNVSLGGVLPRLADATFPILSPSRKLPSELIAWVQVFQFSSCLILLIFSFEAKGRDAIGLYFCFGSSWLVPHVSRLFFFDPSPAACHPKGCSKRLTRDK